MSIINDALKKTESSLQQKEAKNNPGHDHKNLHRPYLLYILILLIGIFLSNLIFNFLAHKAGAALPPKIKTLSPAISPAAQPITFTPPTPAQEKKPSEGRFILNGIFFSDSDSYALINNQIVRENEFVDGAKVLRINEDSVELENLGQPVILNSSR